MKRIILNGLLAILPFFTIAQPALQSLNGAWEAEKDDNNTRSIVIISDGYFSVTNYANDRFISTMGGIIEARNNQIVLTYEFNTEDSTQVGTSIVADGALENDQITYNGMNWHRIDDGTPGELNGAWLMVGRDRDGERRKPGARKTMKILSGTRFQWIAYHTETGQFFGTGGGNYTTEDGKYTEQIEFFSRDQSRVGMSLTFEYELIDNEWHHKGNNSRGEPLYEVWGSRESLLVAK